MPAVSVTEQNTMFSIKREPSDTVAVGEDSQRIRLMDDNSHISNTLNINTSDNLADKSLRDEILLTVAYVKNESTSNAFDSNASNTKGNEDIYRQRLLDINDVTTDKMEACIDNTSGTWLMMNMTQYTWERTRNMITVVSKFVGPVGQSDISYECPTKNVGVPDQMSDRNYKKISIWWMNRSGI